MQTFLYKSSNHSFELTDKRKPEKHFIPVAVIGADDAQAAIRRAEQYMQRNFNGAVLLPLIASAL